MTAIQPTAPGDGYVYFVGESDAIKIGFSIKPSIRLGQLRREFPRIGPVWMIGTIAGTMDDEGILKGRFRHLQIKGEWFRVGHDLVEFIDGLEAKGRIISIEDHRELRRKTLLKKRHHRHLAEMRDALGGS